MPLPNLSGLFSYALATMTVHAVHMIDAKNSIPANAPPCRDVVVDSKNEKAARPTRYIRAAVLPPTPETTKPFTNFPAAPPSVDRDATLATNAADSDMVGADAAAGRMCEEGSAAITGSRTVGVVMATMLQA
mmetsp:Transcript_2388/g.4947  ORF Transcript_2388/g.4947 Transcript_2388/m.4947 type:complete len:132 (-) Transcript_2388:767-1162(-)